MGNLLVNIARVQVYANVDSICEPGQKSVMSEPIGKDLYEDFDEFFAEVVAHCRAPILPWNILFVKDMEFKELEDEKTEAIIWGDGKLRKLLHLQESEDDTVIVWMKVQVDWKAHTVVCEDLEHPSGKSKSIATAAFHFDEASQTFRVESWLVMDGERLHGAQWAWFMEWLYLKPHLVLRSTATKVKVRALKTPPTGGDMKIALSGDMSEYFADAEAILDALVAQIKKEALDLKGTVDYGDDADEVLIKMNIPPQLVSATGLQTGDQLQWVRRLSIRKEESQLVINISVDGTDDTAAFVQVYQVYTEPLRVGSWNRRKCSTVSFSSHNEAGELSMRLNKLVTDLAVIKEVDSLDEKNFYF
mmetsp:Transcript_109924/g.342694  ORF Transcript_109924/g.342694 Transcript_109924/m.342694 type:complete len:360 (-) Transcript_109924:84-1163(-)